MFGKILRSSLIIAVVVALVGALAWFSTPPTQAASPAPQAAQTDEQAQGPRGAGLLVGALVRSTADLSNLKPEDVMKEVRAGKSLAQIASANGSSGDKVVADVVAKAKQRLDRAVAAGRITQDQATTRLTKVQDEATKLVNDTALGQKIERRLDQVKGRAVKAALVKQTADATGLSVRDITQRLRNGESLEQIATSAGKNSADIVQAATDAFRTTAEQVMKETK